MVEYDYAMISVKRYAEHLFNTRPTRDGRDERTFEELTDQEQRDWQDRARHNIEKFVATVEEYHGMTEHEEVEYRDRTGIPIEEGDILVINPDDDEWYDVVERRDDGRLELASFMDGYGHVMVSLESALDACDVAHERYLLEAAMDEAAYRIEALDTMQNEYGTIMTFEGEQELNQARAAARLLQRRAAEQLGITL